MLDNSLLLLLNILGILRTDSMQCMLKIVKKRRATWMGDILRHDGPLLAILEGCVEGSNGRGRPSKEYISQIKVHGPPKFHRAETTSTQHGQLLQTTSFFCKERLTKGLLTLKEDSRYLLFLYV